MQTAPRSMTTEQKKERGRTLRLLREERARQDRRAAVRQQGHTLAMHVNDYLTQHERRFLELFAGARAEQQQAQTEQQQYDDDDDMPETYARTCTLSAEEAFAALLWVGEGLLIANIAAAARPSGLHEVCRDVRGALHHTRSLPRRCTLSAQCAFAALLWVGDGMPIAAIAAAARPSGLYRACRDVRGALHHAQCLPRPKRACALCADPWCVDSPPCSFACEHEHLICADCVAREARCGAVGKNGRPVAWAWEDPPPPLGAGEDRSLAAETSSNDAVPVRLARRKMHCPACVGLRIDGPIPLFRSVTAWSWLPGSQPVDVGLGPVEIADLPRGHAWELVREGATCRIYDEHVATRISHVLAQMGEDEPSFWVQLAQHWAVSVHGGDVRKATRLGLGRNPAQGDLRKVTWKPYLDVVNVMGTPRADDHMCRRAMQESGKSSGQ